MDSLIKRIDTLLSRKKFLSLLTGMAAVTPVVLIVRMITKRKKALASAQGTITLPLTFSQGINIFDKVIVIQEKNKITVLSTRCPHLGCRIDTVKDNNLLCPCHGSTFSAQGVVLKGPALKDLTKLPYTIDRKKKILVISLG